MSPIPGNFDDLANGVILGNKRSIAKAISFVENRAQGYLEFLSLLKPQAGKAHILGITGSPGAGKSTLVSKLTKEFRARGLTVGIIAVDPSSPFSQGAVLGDRIRMQDLAQDKGIFIRSMASRGQLGGVARDTKNAALVLDAAGKDIILIETIGVGQNEIDVINVSHTTLLVLTPGAGDGVQAMKAGIMEIADIFVINKADLLGADRVAWEVSKTLAENKPLGGWEVPVIKTSTVSGEGIKTVIETAAKHRQFLEHTSSFVDNSSQGLVNETVEIVLESLRKQIKQEVEKEGLIKNPYSIALKILERIQKN